ncbi:MAG: hypothetical protein AABW83_02400 [Nanoarchaeota archaeon]
MDTKELEINVKNIMFKLANIQSDMNYIKEKLLLKEEIEMLEQFSAEDSADFFEKYDL